MTHIHNYYDNSMIEKIMHDMNALLIIKRTFEKFYVKNKTNISKRLQSVKKNLKKKLEKLKNKFQFKLNDVLKIIIIIIINSNFFIIINTFVITTIIKTNKQPLSFKKTDMGSDSCSKKFFQILISIQMKASF